MFRSNFAAALITLLVGFSSRPTFAQARHSISSNHETAGESLNDKPSKKSKIDSSPCKMSDKAKEQIRSKGESGIILNGIQFDLYISSETKGNNYDEGKHISLKEYLQGVGKRDGELHVSRGIPNFFTAVVGGAAEGLSEAGQAMIGKEPKPNVKGTKQGTVSGIKFSAYRLNHDGTEIRLVTENQGKKYNVELRTAGRWAHKTLKDSELKKTLNELLVCK